MRRFEAGVALAYLAANWNKSWGCLRMTSLVKCFRTSSKPAGTTICNAIYTASQSGWR